ncbi:hypothetical protein ACOSQ3_023456 [Xanthoceras sorbifolium]
MQAELVGSNNHKYGTWIRASSPPKERFSNVNKFSSNLEGSVNDGIQLQGRSDRNSGGNGGDKSCGLNDTTISHVSAKGNEKIGADTVQDSSVEKIDKDADFPPEAANDQLLTHAFPCNKMNHGSAKSSKWKQLARRKGQALSSSEVGMESRKHDEL